LSNSSSRSLLAGSRGNLHRQTHNSILSEPCTSYSFCFTDSKEDSHIAFIVSPATALQSLKDVASMGKSLQGIIV